MLRWADSPSASAFELPVEMVDENGFDPIIRASLNIGEETPVTLVAEEYMINGIVRSCRADRNSYLITVAIQDVSDKRSGTAYFRDPGALVLDDFLTEEEEAKILESLEDSSRSLARSLRHLLLLPTGILRRLTSCPVSV